MSEPPFQERDHLALLVHRAHFGEQLGHRVEEAGRRLRGRRKVIREIEGELVESGVGARARDERYRTDELDAAVVARAEGVQGARELDPDRPTRRAASQHVTKRRYDAEGAALFHLSQVGLAVNDLP